MLIEDNELIRSARMSAQIPSFKPKTATDRLILPLDVPTVEEARAIVAETKGAVGVYKVGMQLQFAGGLPFAEELAREGHKVFLDVKLLDIDNTVEKAVENIARMGMTFVTIHAYPKTMRAAVAGRGSANVCLLGVTVLTSMDTEDMKAAGYSGDVEELVKARAVAARAAGMGGIVCSAQEAGTLRDLAGPDMVLVTPGIRPAGCRRRRSEARHDAGQGDQGGFRLSRRRPPDHASRRPPRGGRGDRRGDRSRSLTRFRGELKTMAATPLRICLAGVTGGVGRALLPAIVAADDLVLTGAVSRSAAGRDAGEAMGGPAAGVSIVADLESALDQGVDVLIDYTASAAAKAHLEIAIERRIPVVLGTTGFSEAEFEALNSRAQAAGIGIVTGNFSLTAALLQHFAIFAAHHIDQFEVIDACKANKPDAPSGTGRELAEKLAEVKRPTLEVPLGETHGERAARGATVSGVQCHSIRLPGFASSVEVIFGTGAERLSLRHECITHGEPFVTGSLLAARRLALPGDERVVGVVRGLDTLLFS